MTDPKSPPDSGHTLSGAQTETDAPRAETNAPQAEADAAQGEADAAQGEADAAQGEANDSREQGPPSSNPHREFLRRKLPRVLFFIGLGVMVVRMLMYNPVEVDVIFDFGEKRHGLLRAELAYLKEGQEVRRVIFNYQDGEAPVAQRHRLKLLPGDYRVQAALWYGEPRLGQRDGKPLGTRGGTVGFGWQRPLLVRGQGELIVHF